jgi:hypothetical protein
MAIDLGRAQSQSSIRTLIDPSPTVGLQSMKSQPPHAVLSYTPSELLGHSLGIGGSLPVTAAPAPPPMATVVDGHKQTNSSTTLRSEVESAGLATNAISIEAEPGIVRALGSQTRSGSRVSMESAPAVVAKTYLLGPFAQQPIALRAESAEREQLRTSGFEVGSHELVVGVASPATRIFEQGPRYDDLSMQHNHESIDAARGTVHARVLRSSLQPEIGRREPTSSTVRHSLAGGTAMLLSHGRSSIEELGRSLPPEIRDELLRQYMNLN